MIALLRLDGPQTWILSSCILSSLLTMDGITNICIRFVSAQHPQPPTDDTHWITTTRGSTHDTFSREGLFKDLSTLEEIWNVLKGFVPNRGTNGFHPPSAAIVLDFERIVLDMMTIGHPPFHRGDNLVEKDKDSMDATKGEEWHIHTMGRLYSPPKSCDEVRLRSLDGMYRIETFIDKDNQRSYCILSTTSIMYPWGNVIVDLDSSQGTKNLSFDCPHPKFDVETGEQGIRLLKGTKSRSWIVAGSHRMANNESIGTCQPQYSYYPSDAAHSTNNCFLAAVAAIHFYYDSVVHEDYTSVQLHGMGKTSCGSIDTFFSHGICSETVRYKSPYGSDVCKRGPEKIEVLHRVARSHPRDNGNHAIASGDGNACNLCGDTNLQGRFLNGVARKDLCNTFATSYSGRFVHIEQKREYRRESHSQFWNDVFNEAYEQFLDCSTLPKPNIDTEMASFDRAAATGFCDTEGAAY